MVKEHQLTQPLQPATKKYDKYEYVFIANSGEPDSVGDQVDISGMSLERFNANPQIFYQHSGHYSSDPEQGSIATGEVFVEGKKLMLGITKFDLGSERGAEVARKIDEGFINGASIGFIPLEGKSIKGSKGQDVFLITKSELLEVSAVNIPADFRSVRVKSLDKPDDLEKPTLSHRQKTRLFLEIERLKDDEH